jgi:serine/threonine-protein kinase
MPETTQGPPAPPGQGHLFGEVAISLGLVKPEERDAALCRQTDLRSAGAKSRLGEVLMFMKVLDVEQVRCVMSEQRKRRQADANATLPVEVFADYQLLARLGEGGMGAVFRAREVHTNRLVALKVLRKGLAVDQDYLQRFERERAVAAQLQHPNLVATLACGVQHGVQYLAMEYVEGETLREKLNREGRLKEPDALRVALAVARGLAHAHQKGFVHRDIKPENILLAQNGAVKLADLGLVKSVYGDSHLTQTGEIIGTPNYISPEQAEGHKQADPRSDLYQLGATLYHAVTGRVPFQGPSPMAVMLLHITGTLTNPKDLNPELSAGLVQVLVKLLAKKPDQRYAQTGLLIEDLEALQRGAVPKHATLEFSQSSIIAPVVRPGGKGCLSILLLAALVMVLLAALAR